mgnify:CR=1 FL=1
MDVSLASADAAGPLLLQHLCEWLGECAVGCRSTLRSLRLAGPLYLGTFFAAVAPWAHEFAQLEVGGQGGGALPGGRLVSVGQRSESTAVRAAGWCTGAAGQRSAPVHACSGLPLPE